MMIIRSKAPLRLGLAGGGTDVSPYCDEYGGVVLSATIDMYAHCTIEPGIDGQIRFFAADRDEYEQHESAASVPAQGRLLLHKGVYNRIVKEYNGGRPLSLKMNTYADAPAGSGLGTSSTMVVAMLKAYMEWLNLPLGEYDMARLAYQIERVDLGLSGGRQDQYAATFGGFNFIEFEKKDRVIVNPLRIKNWIKNELESSLLLCYTGTSRDSATIIDEQIRNVQGNVPVPVENLHRLKRSAYEMKECILKGNFSGFARGLRDSWESKKKLASVITNPAIDEMYAYMMEYGADAAKISGAGGGGFMMVYCDPARRYELAEKLKQRKFDVRFAAFTEKGTQAWTLYD